MEFIAFVVLMGLFGRFIWSQFGQGVHGTGASEGNVTPWSRENDTESMESSPSADEYNDGRWMAGEDYHGSPDYVTDPTYCWMPGNIFHDDITGGCSGPDWMTDPGCSYMPGNIYHDDMPGSCTGTDTITDPACSFMPENIFHDDGMSSFSSDDSWSSSSFSDDSWSSSSSFDDW